MEERGLSNWALSMGRQRLGTLSLQNHPRFMQNLKMDRLQISNTAEGAVQLTMDAKKEELANAPSFKSKRELDNEKQAADRARNVPGRPSTSN